MNNTRWLLLIPLIISSICLIGALPQHFRLRGLHPDPILQDKYIKWHEENVRSNDPQILKLHSEKLWEQLAATDEVTAEKFHATSLIVSGIVGVLTVNLIFCAAAFFVSANVAVKKL